MRFIFSLFTALLLPVFAGAEPIQIPGPSGPLEADLLLVPEAEDIVVIVPGSGPVDRDGNGQSVGLSTDTYRLLAEQLQAAGISSLRIDKRGFFGSSKAIDDPNKVTIAAYAEDAGNWIARADDDAPCVWLAGHSEGGLVSLVAATQAPETLCGVILLASPGRPVGQLMIEQFRSNPANAPLLPELEAIVTGLEAGEIRDPDSVTPMLQPLFTQGLQRYMMDLFSYDPAAIAQEWTGAALILQGSADLQVTVKDATLLKAALPQARLAELEAVTHMLKADVPGNPFATYQDRSLPLDNAVVREIVTFIQRPR